jgi:cyclic dehypoxanthinyl futalosine synthase
VSREIARLLERAGTGERLTPAEGLQLLEHAELNELGRAAQAVTRRLHPEPLATYAVDRIVNYTNVCVTDCDFCAYSRKPGDSEAYVLSREELHAKLRELVACRGTQVLLQGGHHPDLKIDWYEELLRDLKSRYPVLNLHAFSASEIWHIHKISKITLVETLQRLKAAGMGSLPGGGAEILTDRVRAALTVNKVMTEEWLEVHRQWHKLGGRSTCTMMFGHVETLAERIEHLDRLRQLQDEIGGFTAFICWTFQPENTRLKAPTVGAHEYLRMQALARIFLDNFPNVQSSWVTQGPQIGQIALQYGANDFGSVMMEENVVSQAGATFRIDEATIQRLIRELGYTPHRRNNWYQLLN